jgi:hypothetical protein
MLVLSSKSVPSLARQLFKSASETHERQANECDEHSLSDE